MQKKGKIVLWGVMLLIALIAILSLYYVFAEGITKTYDAGIIEEQNVMSKGGMTYEEYGGSNSGASLDKTGEAIPFSQQGQSSSSSSTSGSTTDTTTSKETTSSTNGKTNGDNSVAATQKDNTGITGGVIGTNLLSGSQIVMIVAIICAVFVVFIIFTSRAVIKIKSNK